MHNSVSYYRRSFLSYIDFELLENELGSMVIIKQHSKVVGISISGQIYDPPSQYFLANSGFFNFHDVNICLNSATAGYNKCLNLNNAPVLSSHKKTPWPVGSYHNK